MHRSAVVYLVNHHLVIGASRRTATGLQLEVEPRALQADSNAEEVAATLLSALDASEPTEVQPGDWKGVFDPFLRAAGVKSYKAFMSGARSVNVDEQDGAFLVSPNCNLGPSEGFEPITSESLRLSDLPSVVRAVLEKLRAT